MLIIFIEIVREYRTLLMTGAQNWDPAKMLSHLDTDRRFSWFIQWQIWTSYWTQPQIIMKSCFMLRWRGKKVWMLVLQTFRGVFFPRADVCRKSVLHQTAILFWQDTKCPYSKTIQAAVIIHPALSFNGVMGIYSICFTAN